MSSADACVIQGEAPESDDEQENSVKYGVAVDGEAPESDDELVSFRKTLSDGCKNQFNSDEFKVDESAFKDSILKTKLCENNSSLWKNLILLVQNTVLSASKQLMSTDQQLLKSQVTLQAASYNLKTSNATSKQVLNKTKNIFSANFIPPIKM